MEPTLDKFTPIGELLLTRAQAQQRIENRLTRTEDHLTARIRAARKRLLGSGLPLEPLLVANGKVDDDFIDYLVNCLTAYTAHFAREAHNDYNCEDLEDFLNHFFKYSLYMYTTDSIGDDSVDDIIQLAECYSNSPDVFSIVAEDNLPNDMVEEMQEWIGYSGEHPIAPEYFERHVSSAIGVLLGAMRDPAGTPSITIIRD